MSITSQGQIQWWSEQKNSHVLTAYLFGSFFRVFITLLLSPKISDSQGVLRTPHISIPPLQE